MKTNINKLQRYSEGPGEVKQTKQNAKLGNFLQ